MLRGTRSSKALPIANSNVSVEKSFADDLPYVGNNIRKITTKRRQKTIAKKLRKLERKYENSKIFGSNIPGVMIFIDFQKAFVSLEWNYLLDCLQHFNLGPDFI